MRLASPEESAPAIGAALASAIARLRAAGVAEPEADAQVLLAHALATSRAGVIAAARDPLDPEPPPPGWTRCCGAAPRASPWPTSSACASSGRSR